MYQFLLKKRSSSNFLKNYKYTLDFRNPEKIIEKKIFLNTILIFMPRHNKENARRHKSKARRAAENLRSEKYKARQRGYFRGE